MEHLEYVGEGGTFDDGLTTLGLTTLDVITDREDETDRDLTSLEDDDDDDASSTIPSWFTDHESLSLSEGRSEITTPLYEALEEGNYEAVIRFLKTGEFYQYNCFPFTLLRRQFASEMGSPDEQASTWVTKKFNRQLPLHLALSTRAPLEVVDLLIETYSKSVQQPDARGNLPLHLAIMNNCHRLVIMSLLKKYPPAIEFKNEAGLNPLDCVEQIADVQARQRGQVIRNYVEGAHSIGQQRITPLKHDIRELGRRLDAAKKQLRLAQLELEVEKDHLVQLEDDKVKEDRRMKIEVEKMRSEIAALRHEKERLHAEKERLQERIELKLSDDVMSNAAGWIDSEMTRIVSELNTNSPLATTKLEIAPSTRSDGQKDIRYDDDQKKLGSGFYSVEQLTLVNKREDVERQHRGVLVPNATLNSISGTDSIKITDVSSRSVDRDPLDYVRLPNMVKKQVANQISRDVTELMRKHMILTDMKRQREERERNNRDVLHNPVCGGMTGNWQEARDNNCMSPGISDDERDAISYGSLSEQSDLDYPRPSNTWQPRNYGTREQSAAEIRRDGPMDELIKMVRSQSIEKTPDRIRLYASVSKSQSRLWEEEGQSRLSDEEGFIDEYFEGNRGSGEEFLRYHRYKMGGETDHPRDYD